MPKKYKLVRDKIPEVAYPGLVFKEDADLNEFQVALLAKLDEEVLEYKESGELEELADILEVIRALALTRHNTLWVDLKRAQARKYFQRGGFSKRMLLEIDE